MSIFSRSAYALLFAAFLPSHGYSRDVRPRLPNASAASVQVALKRVGSVDKLVVQITNTTMRPLILRSNTLPWTQRGALFVAITEPVTQTLLHQDHVISDTV